MTLKRRGRLSFLPPSCNPNQANRRNFNPQQGLFLLSWTKVARCPNSLRALESVVADSRCGRHRRMGRNRQLTRNSCATSPYPFQPLSPSGRSSCLRRKSGAAPARPPLFSQSTTVDLAGHLCREAAGRDQRAANLNRCCTTGWANGAWIFSRPCPVLKCSRFHHWP